MRGKVGVHWLTRQVGGCELVSLGSLELCRGGVAYAIDEDRHTTIANAGWGSSNVSAAHVALLVVYRIDEQALMKSAVFREVLHWSPSPVDLSRIVVELGHLQVELDERCRDDCIPSIFALSGTVISHAIVSTMNTHASLYMRR
jgi:hypothetical protein